MNPVDVVIAWVDGSDPVLSAKRRLYGNDLVFSREDLASSTRYSSLGEIFWCVASINRNAPWIRKIFIMTDSQDPGLEPYLEEHFPEGHIPVEIVDHRDIFRGYEDFLPVFNSISIETMMWRIPGLSERFIYMNDDFIIASPVQESDFYDEDGHPICYATRSMSWFTKFTRKLKHTSDGVKRATFKGMMVNASDLAGVKLYHLKVGHTPRAHTRSFYEDFYAKHPDAIVRNIRCRFRDADQYLPDLLEYSVGESEGRIKLIPYKKVLFFIQPKPKKDYVRKKMEKARNGHFKFWCINSLDQASEEEQKIIVSSIETRL